jgi:hypothetical protein
VISRLLIFSIFLTACDADLKEGPRLPSVRNNHADVSISARDGVATTAYKNISDSTYFRCRRDQKGLMFLEAKTNLKLASGEIAQQWFSFWFPMPAVSVSVEENSFSASQGIQMYGTVLMNGRVVKLGGSLRGRCQTSLSRIGDQIVGDISCMDFEATGKDRLTNYDLKIADLSCLLEPY